MVDDNRAIFMYKDGSQAWDAKDFLIQQEDCVDVTIENQIYQGPANGFIVSINTFLNLQHLSNWRSTKKIFLNLL